MSTMRPIVCYVITNRSSANFSSSHLTAIVFPQWHFHGHQYHVFHYFGVFFANSLWEFLYLESTLSCYYLVFILSHAYEMHLLFPFFFEVTVGCLIFKYLASVQKGGKILFWTKVVFFSVVKNREKRREKRCYETYHCPGVWPPGHLYEENTFPGETPRAGASPHSGTSVRTTCRSAGTDCRLRNSGGATVPFTSRSPANTDP